MNKDWKHIINAGPCPEPEMLELYYYGKLPDDKRFAVENHLAECPMCSDYVEGLSLLTKPSSLQETEDELREKVHQLFKKQGKKIIFKPFYKKMAVAAGILLFISLSTFIYYNSTKQIEKISELAAPLNKQEEQKTVSKPAPEIKEERKQVAQHLAKRNIAKTQYDSVSEKVSYDESLMTVESKEAPLETSENKVYDKVNIPSKAASPTIRIRGLASVKDSKRALIGTVTDETGSPMPGVNVTIKDKETGVVSDINGNFALILDSTDTAIDLAFVGYKKEKVDIKDKSEVSIKMEPEVMALNEVVVIGYGTQKKSDVTGAVAGVRIEELNKTSEKEKLELKLQNQTLENTPDTIKLSFQSQKQLALNYLKLNNYNKSIEALQNLKNVSNENDAIDLIIGYVDKHQYRKALKKLKKIKK